jgi:hypothetical protein
LGGAKTDGMALMEVKTSDSAEQYTADACQDCGAPEVQHCSLMRRDGDHHGTIVLLCDDCHRGWLALAQAFEWA